MIRVLTSALTLASVFLLASFAGIELPMLLPGVTASTGSIGYQPLKQLQLMRFNGETWDSIDMLSGR